MADAEHCQLQDDRHWLGLHWSFCSDNLWWADESRARCHQQFSVQQFFRWRKVGQWNHQHSDVRRSHHRFKGHVQRRCVNLNERRFPLTQTHLDSGGPIQITLEDNQCLYHVIGITSFGSPFCGQKNSPGVYTRVSAYIGWIEGKVWR